MAEAVEARTGTAVVAASARFADRVPIGELGGRAGETLASAVARVLRERGRPHHFVILPAFLGPSDTLRTLVPDFFRGLGGGGGVTYTVSRHLVVPGDDRVALAMERGVREALATHALAPEATAVVLCDHGSPHADVGAVRGIVARQLEGVLEDGAALGGHLRAPLAQASMERREGAAYDFNDPLLEKLLRTPPYNAGTVVLALLFLSPGTHAGPGGDIDQIVQAAVEEAAQAGRELRVYKTELLGSRVAEVLADRLRESLAALSV